MHTSCIIKLNCSLFHAHYVNCGYLYIIHFSMQWCKITLKGLTYRINGKFSYFVLLRFQNMVQQIIICQHTTQSRAYWLTKLKDRQPAMTFFVALGYSKLTVYNVSWSFHFQANIAWNKVERTKNLTIHFQDNLKV